ncbi:hypothetical protein E4U49_006023 [Claviceps purpurea]|nr:hypothetical protein E4U49_006023 [Claviceps purpurea]
MPTDTPPMRYFPQPRMAYITASQNDLYPRSNTNPRPIRYLFHKENVPRIARRIKLKKLAYVTAIQNDLCPTDICRSELHNTSFDRLRGEVKPDTEGWHLTVSFKTQELVNSREHLTCHANVDSLGQFKNATFDTKKPKPDGKMKCNSRQPFWPAKPKLLEVPTKLVTEVSVTEPDYSGFVITDHNY